MCLFWTTQPERSIISKIKIARFVFLSSNRVALLDCRSDGSALYKCVIGNSARSLHLCIQGGLCSHRA